jgi:hypothetical protein
LPEEREFYDQLASRILALERLTLQGVAQSIIHNSQRMIGETKSRIGELNEDTMRRAILLRLVNDLAIPFLTPTCGACKRYFSPCPTPEKRDAPSTTTSADVDTCYEMAEPDYPENDLNQQLLETVQAKYAVTKEEVLQELKDLLTHFSPRPKFRSV